MLISHMYGKKKVSGISALFLFINYISICHYGACPGPQKAQQFVPGWKGKSGVVYDGRQTLAWHDGYSNAWKIGQICDAVAGF